MGRWWCALAVALVVGSADAATSFRVWSPAFPPGGRIPRVYTCDGRDLSPPLRWAGAPVGTRSFVLIVDDPDAPGGTFTHWVLFDIPATRTDLPEALPRGAVGKSGTTSFGRAGYGGPCPPSGVHRYVFTLYALDVPSLGLREGSPRSAVERAMRGHVLASARYIGRYGR
jgi:Raf kinase inhibitor-like YbhB/YbcL family protein